LTKIKMNKTYCTFPTNGMFISDRGVGLCCESNQYYNLDPLEFWHSAERKLLLEKQKNGVRVKQCQPCYDAEDRGILSIRQLHNSNKNTKIRDLPTKLDLDFSNFCNLKCVMCGPNRSSQWAKDLGINKNTNGIRAVSPRVFKDTCELSHQLEELVIQGGEPSIMPEFEEYFKYLKENNLIGNIKLQVITNLTNINNRFFEYLKEFKSVTLGVSIDSFGRANDYIRFPSNFDKITNNLIKISKMNSKIEVEVFNSIQILSLFNYDKFLKWYLTMKKEFASRNSAFKMIAMKVITPKIYNLFNAPEKLKQKFKKDVDEFFLNHPDEKRNKHFYIQLQLILKKMLSSSCDDDTIDSLKKQIQALDNKRSIKITNYIPDFHNYI